jgi:hypothetical protein
MHGQNLLMRIAAAMQWEVRFHSGALAYRVEIVPRRPGKRSNLAILTKHRLPAPNNKPAANSGTQSIMAKQYAPEAPIDPNRIFVPPKNLGFAEGFFPTPPARKQPFAFVLDLQGSN